MTAQITRSKRLRKKLYLEEFAIVGFEFSYKLDLESTDAYEAFLDSFVDLIDTLNLIVNLDGDHGVFQGFVSSGERYGSTTEDDRTAIKDALESYDTVSDVVVQELVDAVYMA
ncbi:MAG: hypothetical protein ACI93R_001704 [Flavobacteriales bacterium]|jgi:uncharacterized protein YggL (DUF469 family)